MFKSEYFSNSYRVIITKKQFHFIFILIEYLITSVSQKTIYITKFKFDLNEDISTPYFYAIFIQQINKLSEFIKLLIIIIVFISIIFYFFVYNKFAFEKNIFNIIIINIYEIAIFRLILIIIFHILFAIKGITKLIMIILLIPVLCLIIKNFIIVHLYYFSPHFVVYPYDYYSSGNDVFHILEKILISISLQSSNKYLNAFLFICCFILQFMNFLISIYLFYNKSYYIMSNIILNKMRFSLIASSVINNILLLLLGNKNYITYTYLFISINIYLAVFLFLVIFYNPYSFAHFSNDDNIENLYFYYYIIDHLRNDNFIVEEKIKEHLIKCQRCNLCKNLRNFLNKKKCYKIIYKILYNKVDVLEHTMNELIHTVLVKGKEALKNNSFYLINLMYCYYINHNKKKFVLSQNLKLLFEIINLENKNILENHLLSTEQILLINEFLSKADNILDKIKIILTETLIKEKINYFFNLPEIIFELKSKKFRSKLYYNKNEGIINFYKYISICTMIYEEIFNLSLSNGGMTLKENQFFLDDISNKNINSLNQIIIQLDLLSFENKIIYVIGELAKYKDKALCQLFPNIFKMQQCSLMKDKIMNSKLLTCINKDKDFFQNDNTKGKNNEEHYICLKLLIYDELEHKKIFVMISLKLNLIYPLNISKKILLTGFYSVDKNIIISLDKSTKESKKEIILNSDEKKYESEIRNYSSNEIELIKFKKNDKYYNGKKLFFITKFFINPNCYNIYSIFHTEKQRTFKKEKIMDEVHKNNNKYEDSKNNIYVGVESNTQNFNFMMMSQTSSTFNQITNDIQGFKKRDKGGKKENKKNNYFKYCQFNLIFISIAILLFEIIIHIILNNSTAHIDNKNSALTLLKNYYSIFMNVFTTTLTISCLADTPKGSQCGSIITDFNKKFFKGPQRGPPLNFIDFLFLQNKGATTPLGNVRQQILQVLSESEDKNLNNLVNEQIITLVISQNITKDGTILLAYKQNNSFIDVLNYMTTGFMVLYSNVSNLNNIVYIINKVNYNENWNYTEVPFKNVNLTGQLTQYQSYFYYLILNFQQFLNKLDAISINIAMSTSDTVLSNLSTIKTFIIILLIIFLLLQGIIFFYIQNYFKILAELFNNIEKKLDLKNDDISIREMFLQKIEKLKIIISLYKQDIYQAIVDLNFIYDNYKKFIEEKNKEIAKYLKKEKFLSDKNYEINDKNKKIIKKHITYNQINRKYLYFIIICSLISIIISIVLYCIWDSYETIYNRMLYLVNSHGNLSSDALKLVSYYQLMLYNSITLDDINNYEGLSSVGKDYFEKIYTDLEDLYESKRYMEKLKEYDLDNIDKYFNFTCESFYEQLYQTNTFLLNYPLSRFYQHYLINICSTANVFKSNNYKQIFTILFEMIQVGINQIDDHSYQGLISHKKSEHYTKSLTTFLFVYYYTFEIIGTRVQRQSYLKISEIIERYLIICFTIYYIATVVFIVLIIFLYIYQFNKNYYKLHDMKKVFKICNKRD